MVYILFRTENISENLSYRASDYAKADILSWVLDDSELTYRPAPFISPLFVSLMINEKKKEDIFDAGRFSAKS